ALLRTLLIGQILLDSTARVVIDEQAVTKLKQWVREWQVLNKQISDIRRRWLYPNAYNTRQSKQRIRQATAGRDSPVLPVWQNPSQRLARPRQRLDRPAGRHGRHNHLGRGHA
ncbi:membrane protein, partial [Pseudomonas syringae pv. actinidiae ICMP 19068]